jgi:hypothetical protein
MSSTMWWTTFRRAATLQPMRVKEPLRGGAEDLRPERVIGSIFRVRRDLAALIRRHVIPGTGLTVEESDILTDLYGARHLGWQDPRADADGYVSFAALRVSLVHSAAALSRGMALMTNAGYVEVENAAGRTRARPGTDRKAKVARITEMGVKKIRPVYERYCRLCAHLLDGVPRDNQLALLKVNEALMRRIRWDI